MEPRAKAPHPGPALTQIFRGNLSLPESGGTRIVCIFDLSHPNGWIHKNLNPKPLPAPLFDTIPSCNALGNAPASEVTGPTGSEVTGPGLSLQEGSHAGGPKTRARGLDHFSVARIAPVITHQLERMDGT